MLGIDEKKFSGPYTPHLEVHCGVISQEFVHKG